MGPTGAALAVMLVGPFLVGDYGLTLGFTLCIYASMASAWNLIGGYGGQFSLGHGLFVGSGAYTLGVLLVHTQLPVTVDVVLGGLISSLLAALAGLPLLRLRAAYFSLIARLVRRPVVDDQLALHRRDRGSVSTDRWPTRRADAVLPGAWPAGGDGCQIGLLVRSRFGLRLMAVRDDEDAAAELGVNGFTVKLAAFTISGSSPAWLARWLRCKRSASNRTRRSAWAGR